ncbi:MAG: hypothetical protein AMS19_12230 [Gemmatimonas sp. SG8_23]|nr:MAG: hypothetical protein AMS19_12230 [Gemmatimonas sp. SG8_23]
MRVLVTGAAGLLGSEFVTRGRRHGYEVTGLRHAELDVTDRAAVRDRIAAEPLDWVVHCAAYTAVDRAEREPELAFRVNEGGAGHVAEAAAAADVRTVFVSTDYVFDGRAGRPYRPSDPPNPLSVYGRSKWAGERAVRRAYEGAASPDSRPLIVRTGWLYGAGGRGFVRAMLERAERGERLTIVDDQTGGPTWARNVADHVFGLMAREVDGVWHVADRGKATWLELAGEALRIAGIEADVAGTSTEAWDAPAPRPQYSVLDVAATERELGGPMEDWREALERCLSETTRVDIKGAGS